MNSLALVEAQSSSFAKFRPGFTTTPRTEGAIYIGTREGGRKEKKHKMRLPSCKVSHETNVQSNSRAGEEPTFASTAGCGCRFTKQMCLGKILCSSLHVFKCLSKSKEGGNNHSVGFLVFSSDSIRKYRLLAPPRPALSSFLRNNFENN